MKWPYCETYLILLRTKCVDSKLFTHEFFEFHSYFFFYIFLILKLNILCINFRFFFLFLWFQNNLLNFLISLLQIKWKTTITIIFHLWKLGNTCFFVAVSSFESNPKSKFDPMLSPSSSTVFCFGLSGLKTKRFLIIFLQLLFYLKF